MPAMPSSLRRQVIERAGSCCEYCLLPQQGFAVTFHIDHVISEKHQGETLLENLCLSCPECNLYKGSDISGFDAETQQYIGLDNPRLHVWTVHFKLNGARIEPITPEGRVTESLLRLNDPIRIMKRSLLIQEKLYPCQPTDNPHA